MEHAETVKNLQHDGTISIATASSRTSIKWQNQELLWSDFLDKLSTTVRTKETAAEYRKMPKTKQDQIKDVGGFVGGRLKGGRRKADKVFNRSILTLDIDYGEEGMADIIDMLFSHAYALYSTHKHTSEKPRLRFLVPFTRPVTAEEYVAIGKKVAEQIGIDYFDDTSYQPHRLMYWPSTSTDAEFVFSYQDAPWLDPDKVLAKYTDWRDPLEWPESSRQQLDRKKLADKQGDPHEKAGLVGAFCRTYTIEEAIETFLSDRYEKFQEGRYTYVHGSTAGGLIIYDDGKFAYSHHGTDPVSSQLVNAFDLVRIHLFGLQDEDADPKTPVNRLPSYTAMREFVRKDPGVKEAAARERLDSAVEEFDEIEIDVEEKPDLKWTRKLTYDKSGEVESTVPNIVLVLENDPLLKGKIATNEFSNRLMLRGSVPWRKVVKSENWTDGDDAGLRDYLERIYHMYNRGKTEDAVKVISEKHRFHPIRDYLKPLEWDGTPRLDTLFIDYLGADDTELNRAVTRKAFTAAVARVMKPGIKFDYMLTLYGAQGVGKSMILDRMGREWFSDSITSVSGKEAFEALQGAWIIEMGELSATRKADVESIKHFISKREDRFRVAYGRHTEDFPRQCVFFGTTNDANFLKDKTGGRRFWPVTVNAEKRKKRWSELTDSEIGQLWAEAKHYYEEGEPLYLNDRMEAEMRLIQEAHTEESPWFGLVQEYLERKLPEDWEEKDLAERRMFLSDDFGESKGTITRNRVCALEVWCECLGNDARRFSPLERREINDILRKMPGWKPNDSNMKGTLRFGKLYGVQRAYIREEDLI
ncbi:hypothetical protein BTO30_12385 [Domibacillus antri]|uniref:Virulence-associated protein E-like domain-containing protein n=1 Tax=Domibacillus antri TaxID=1714264 RepID=A0A1Q8Q3G9_9BACI|nr:virulence-associated E family protein [Domibacillus antri]OLN21889.1 hypothetical protein BTO30_12385 [Domibacillus antri]